MLRLLIMVLIGLFAQLIDGSLGMSYGVSTTTFLLASGLSPAMASAVSHMSGVATTTASGISHWKFKNINRRLVKTIALPGAIGAFTGAVLLSNIPGYLAKPYIAGFLFLLGCYILIRFLIGNHQNVQQGDVDSNQDITLKNRFVIPLGLFAGFMDTIGGGGWGPLMTPILLMHRNIKTRKVIGSVDTSEIAVVFSGTVAFIISLGVHQIHWLWVGTLMAGGIVAAPIAAWIVRIIPGFILGVLVGGMIILMNAHTVMHSGSWLPVSWDAAIYATIITVWFCSIAFVLWRRHDRKTSTEDTTHSKTA